jgi:hypothetical protein
MSAANQSDDNSTATSGGNEASSSDKKSGGMRQWILLGLLAVMACAIVYDYQIARPTVVQAFDTLDTASQKINRAGTDVMTNDKVQEVLEKKPSRSFDDGPKVVEEFHFTSGLIVKPHKLFAVYRKRGDELVFERAEVFVYEPANGSSTETTFVEVEMDTEEPSSDGGGQAAPSAAAPSDSSTSAGSSTSADDTEANADNAEPTDADAGDDTSKP